MTLDAINARIVYYEELAAKSAPGSAARRSAETSLAAIRQAKAVEIKKAEDAAKKAAEDAAYQAKKAEEAAAKAAADKAALDAAARAAADRAAAEKQAADAKKAAEELAKKTTGGTDYKDNAGPDVKTDVLGVKLAIAGGGLLVLGFLIFKVIK